MTGTLIGRLLGFFYVCVCMLVQYLPTSRSRWVESNSSVCWFACLFACLLACLPDFMYVVKACSALLTADCCTCVCVCVYDDDDIGEDLVEHMIWIAAGQSLPSRLLTTTQMDEKTGKEYKVGLLQPKGLC